MKNFSYLPALLCAALSVHAASTINTANRYSFGANIGWMDWRAGDGANGALIGEYVCSGYIYAANVGWISLGNGTPVNGIRYQNNSGTDYGVNQDGLGNLRGYAYAANIGWIAFEDAGSPKVDLATGNLSGYIYSANCGWIALSTATAYVQTDTIAPAVDTDHNGLPDAWELQHFGYIGVDPNADPDGDGFSNLQEYLAGTDPLDATSALRITSLKALRSDTGADAVTLVWASQPSRQYVVEQRTDLSPIATWTSVGTIFGPDAGQVTQREIYFGLPAESHRFFRIKAVRPLSP